MHVRPVTVVDSDGGLAGRYGEQLVHQRHCIVDVAAPKHRARRAADLSNRLPLGREWGPDWRNAACAQHSVVGAAGLLLIRINSLQLGSAVAKDFFLTYFRAISRIPIGVAQAWNCLARPGYVLRNRRVGELFGDWSGLALALIAGAVVLTPIGLSLAASN